MRTRHRSIRPLIAGLAGAGLAAGVLGALPQTAAADPPQPRGSAQLQPAPSSADREVAAPAPYLQQKLTWEPCYKPEELPPGMPPGVLRMQCASFAAPMDWKKAATSAPIRIAVSKLPATTQPARAALFTNPGGPGGAGRDLPALFLAQNRTALLASQDIYGIDVRGTGRSTNATCGGFGGATLDYRDRSATNLNLVLDQNALLARVCNVKGGAFLDQVTTENTVKDLDLLRQLVKQPRINWIGYSGGTWLGAHYATYFPKQTGRFVLDSSNEFTCAVAEDVRRQPAAWLRAAVPRRLAPLGRQASPAVQARAHPRGGAALLRTGPGRTRRLASRSRRRRRRRADPGQPHRPEPLQQARLPGVR
jgi:pimeloyl-ACP methyl ester carboxylesterase